MFVGIGSGRFRLSGKYIDPDDTELSSNVFLTGSAKRIEALAHGHVAKTNSAEYVDKLSLRESTGDSPGPEIDIPAYRLGKLACHDDVSIKKPPTWFKNPERFAVRDRFVGGKD